MVSCLGSEPVRLSSWRSQYNRALRCSAAGHLLKILLARRPRFVDTYDPSPNYQTSTSTLLVLIIVVASADKRVQRHT